MKNVSDKDRARSEKEFQRKSFLLVFRRTARNTKREKDKKYMAPRSRGKMIQYNVLRQKYKNLRNNSQSLEY
uniref:Uncharacterized protein n=1 Tax=Romanomermis culicivorax TaxID=13658 RepID=A0A915KVS4_ROMCU